MPTVLLSHFLRYLEPIPASFLNNTRLVVYFPIFLVYMFKDCPMRLRLAKIYISG
jgi:hypothetical protein